MLKAKEKLLALALEKELDSYCVEIECKTEYHRFLIGRKGRSQNDLNLPKEMEILSVYYIFFNHINLTLI